MIRNPSYQQSKRSRVFSSSDSVLNEREQFLGIFLRFCQRGIVLTLLACDSREQGASTHREQESTNDPASDTSPIGTIRNFAPMLTLEDSRSLLAMLGGAQPVRYTDLASTDSQVGHPDTLSIKLPTGQMYSIVRELKARLPASTCGFLGREASGGAWLVVGRGEEREIIKYSRTGLTSNCPGYLAGEEPSLLLSKRIGELNAELSIRIIRAGGDFLEIDCPDQRAADATIQQITSLCPDALSAFQTSDFGCEFGVRVIWK